MSRDERDQVDRDRRTAQDASRVPPRTASGSADDAGRARDVVVPLGPRRARVEPPSRGPNDDDPGPAAA